MGDVMDTTLRCPQCGKAIGDPVTVKIIDQTRDPGARRNRVRERMMDFCSAICGNHYQMGCEG